MYLPLSHFSNWQSMLVDTCSLCMQGLATSIQQVLLVGDIWSTWLPRVSFPLVFHLLLLLSKCWSPKINVHRYTKHHQLIYRFRLHMPCFTTETSDYHALAVQPPSMFRDLVVPHFRTVPFRSVPLREIVTTFGQTAHASQGNFSKFDALRLLLRQFFDPSSASSVALGRLDSDSTKRLHVVLASFPDPDSRASSQGRTICATATSDQRYS